MSYTLKLTPKGRDFFIGKLPRLGPAFRRGIRTGMLQAGFVLVKTAKDGMEREPKLGRVYVRNGRGRRASAPGQYPGIVTGQTLRGLEFNVRGSSQLEFGILDRPEDPRNLPTWLEHGTSRMAARPTLALADRSRTRDIYTYLARKPHDAQTKV